VVNGGRRHAGQQEKIINIDFPPSCGAPAGLQKFHFRLEHSVNLKKISVHFREHSDTAPVVRPIASNKQAIFEYEGVGQFR
jgi:hypothetical protein